MPPILRARRPKFVIAGIGNMKELLQLLKSSLCYIQPWEVGRSIFQVIPEIIINSWRSMYPYIDQYIKEYLDLCWVGILPSSGLDN
jgi:hypothetical protein